jgi:hypothetical protein
LVLLIPTALLGGVCWWLWKKGVRGRVGACMLFSCAALSVAALLLHESAENARDERLRASLEKELRSRLPHGASKEKIGAVFKEMKLSGDVDETLLPYLTAEVPLKKRGFDDPRILVQVWVDSSRSVERIEATISHRSF